jgi:hypothetical protein
VLGRVFSEKATQPSSHETKICPPISAWPHRPFLSCTSQTLHLSINIVMIKCCSQHRCGQITCTPCARRYASRLSRRILQTACPNLLAIEIDAAISSTADFRQWRVEARNIVDYRRRESRWWRDAGLWVWRCQDETVRGVATLGSVTSDEFIAAFDQRWPITLRPIEPAALMDEVISVTGPGSIFSGASLWRYQTTKFAVWPQRHKRPCAHSLLAIPVPPRIEPMPVML